MIYPFFKIQFFTSKPLCVVGTKNHLYFLSTTDFSTAVHHIEHSNDITTFCLSNTEEEIVVCLSTKALVVYNISDLSVVVETQTRRKVWYLISGDSPRSFLFYSIGDIFHFRYSISPPTFSLQLLFGHICEMTAIHLSHSKTRIITGDYDENIRVSHYPNTFTIDKFLFGHHHFITALIPGSDHNTVITGSGDSHIKLWDIESGNELCDFHFEGENLIVVPQGWNSTKTFFPVVIQNAPKVAIVSSNFEISQTLSLESPALFAFINPRDDSQLIISLETGPLLLYSYNLSTKTFEHFQHCKCPFQDVQKVQKVQKIQNAENKANLYEYLQAHRFRNPKNHILGEKKQKV